MAFTNKSLCSLLLLFFAYSFAAGCESPGSYCNSDSDCCGWGGPDDGICCLGCIDCGNEYHKCLGWDERRAVEEGGETKNDMGLKSMNNLRGGSAAGGK